MKTHISKPKAKEQGYTMRILEMEEKDPDAFFITNEMRGGGDGLAVFFKKIDGVFHLDIVGVYGTSKDLPFIIEHATAFDKRLFMWQNDEEFISTDEKIQQLAEKKKQLK